MPTNLDSASRALLAWANGDVVSIVNVWDICAMNFGEASSREIAALGLAYSVRLVSSGLLVPGRSRREGPHFEFDSWDGSLDRWVSQMAKAWALVEDYPSPASYFELDLTDEGKRPRGWELISD
ncbi:MAG: hypothetical protein J0J03_08280 [Leifsonia sp.]|nr:hypothetical protein [Leifsonia sp.]